MKNCKESGKPGSGNPKSCPMCRNCYRQGYNYCTYCGTHMQNCMHASLCKRCGYITEGAFSYCPMCGNTIDIIHAGS